MKIDQKTIEQARKVDLIGFCEYKELEMGRQGDGNYRIFGHQGLIIKDNYYIQFGTGKDGKAIDFCMQILGMNFNKAVKELIAYGNSGEKHKGTSGVGGSGVAGLKKKDIRMIAGKKEEFMLPERYADNRRVYAYLTKTRGISGELVNELIDSKLLYQDLKGNCVFPCYDLTGEPRGAILRGTLTYNKYIGRAGGSDIKYGWLLKPATESDTVVITESPIDSMSLLMLNFSSKNHYNLALGGVHLDALFRFLYFDLIEHHVQKINNVILALDNDETGRKKTEEIKPILRNDKIKIEELSPGQYKDWNELLLARVV